MLNCIMLAHQRGATLPWEDIFTRVHYVKPKTDIPKSEAVSVIHTVKFGSQGTGGRQLHLAKVAATQAIARCNRYTDTQFIVENTDKVVEALKKATPMSPFDVAEDLLQDLDLVRIAGQGRPVQTAFPPNSVFYQKSQGNPNEEGLGWWNQVQSVRVKRPQMGQLWRESKGLPIFGWRDNNGNLTQTHRQRNLAGPAPTSVPPESERIP